MTPTNFQKHTTTNPIQKFLIENFYRNAIDLIKIINPNKILDAGCGEGFTLERLKKEKLGKKNVGIDFSVESILLGKKTYSNLQLEVGDVYNLKFSDNSFDLVLCNEVLEHLENPQKAVKELMRVSSRYVLFSVPNEPWFMMSNFLRGKYLKNWGNHPEHINHWSIKSFKQFLQEHGYKVIQVITPFPWILVLGKV